MQAGVVGEVATTIQDSHRRQPQRARQAARRSAAVRRRSRAADGADRQGRRQRRQDSEAAQRSCDRVSGNRAVVDPPARPRARSARVGEHRRPAAAGAVERHQRRGGEARDASGLRHRRRRRHRRARDHVQEHVPGADARGHLHLSDSGVAVRVVHASAGDHAVAAAVARRRGGDAVLHAATRSTS